MFQKSLEKNLRDIIIKYWYLEEEKQVVFRNIR
jgi:hypothetical protein